MVMSAEYHVAEQQGLADFLAAKSGLAKARLKDCMGKGGVWLKRQGGKQMRCRKAKTSLQAGDTVLLYYDQDILDQVPATPRLLADFMDYSLWDKPPGLLAQGSQFGDHCSLLRLAAQAFTPAREAYLVHRLDREASGLMLIAHNKKAAGGLSRLFQGHAVLKQYEITVRGLWNQAESGHITLPLDGKEAVTAYQLLALLPEQGNSRLLITLHSGRYHQIRRHFESIGFPVCGDPRYGRANKNQSGLALRAVRLAFDCPLQGLRRDFHADGGRATMEGR